MLCRLGQDYVYERACLGEFAGKVGGFVGCNASCHAEDNAPPVEQINPFHLPRPLRPTNPQRSQALFVCGTPAKR
jgi:hypothetical protein